MKQLHILLLLLIALPVYAQAVYKVVDEEGKVSYTSVEPDKMNDVEVIEAPPTPAQEDIDAAQQQLEDYETQRLQREKAQLEQPKSNAQGSNQNQTTFRVEQQSGNEYIVPVPVRRVRPVNRPGRLPVRRR